MQFDLPFRTSWTSPQFATRRIPIDRPDMRSACSCFTFLLCCLFPVLASAQGRAYPPEFAGARAEVYKQVGDVNLQLWVFDPPSHTRNDPRPAIVFFFGGGWTSGTPAQFEQHGRYLSQQGMVAILADYRVRGRHQTLADRSVADAKSAIRWVRQHAERLGIDRDKIVAAGGSAGGHLAACTAVIQELDEPSESEAISSVPNALALFNPAVVLSPFDGIEIDEAKQSELATRIGVPAVQISPIHHVRPGLPPTIIFHGEADTTVGFNTARRYAEVNQALGNRCDLVGYPGAAHGFFNHGRGGDPGAHYLDTLSRLHGFLFSLGYLDGPPKGVVPESDNVHLRGRFVNSYAAIAERKEATVAFIGGSITEMNGYRVMVERWLQEAFPETKFHFINAGISSTCSTTGAFRLDRDVLRHDPDLLLIEFAVNDDQDASHSAQDCIRGMEGIVRHALEHQPPIDLLLTHFVNPPMLELLQQGETPISIAAHESVASHYGVSTVNLAQEVAERISDGRLTWQQYGGTHPAEAGNSIAAEMVEDLLATAWKQADVERSEAKPTAVASNATETASGRQDVGSELGKRRLPRKMDAKSYTSGRWIDVGSAQSDDRWTLGRPDWSEIPGSLRDRFSENDLLHASEVGAELKLQFEGTSIGLYVLAGPDAGTVEYAIDGAAGEVIDLYHRFSKGLHYPRTVMLSGDLGPGAHELVLRVGPKGNRESGGSAVRILAFTAN